jgi:DNA repair protein RecO (recombination protein O)
MKLFTIDAIILRTKNYNEADKILTLFSKEEGKLDALAKGVRKIKSKNKGAVQLFSLSKIMLHEGKGMHTVTQCQLLNSFKVLNEDLDKMAYAHYVCELIYLMAPYKDANEALFFLLLNTFTALEILDEKLVTRYFELQLLTLMGMSPQLKQCVICSGNMSPVKARFSVDKGGLVCPICSSVNALPISGETVAVMQKFQNIELKQLQRVKISARCAIELEHVLKQYIENYLGMSVKALQFINNLKKLN